MKKIKNIEEICNELFIENNLKVVFSSDTDGYVKSLKRNMDNYLEKVKKLKSRTKFIDGEMIFNIEKLNETISSVINTYLKGDAGRAYSIFKDTLDDLIGELGNLTTDLTRDNGYHELDRTKPFFRVRVSENEIKKKEDLFHIPFSKRELVKTQRYSISGVPSLYLGSSIYCCWLEMGRPLLSKMYVSTFTKQENCNILDFTITYEDFMPNGIEEWGYIYTEEEKVKFKSYLTLYPLIMACSYKKQYDDKSFIIEYVIPNLLLQWIKIEKRLDGIQYYSTKEEHSIYTKNLVFPPKYIGDDNNDYCETLVNKFYLSNPSSWQMLETVCHISDNINSSGQFSNVNDYILKNYKKTKFFAFENFILKSFNDERLFENTK